MSGKGGSCIARYTTGARGTMYGSISKVDSLMLKFRPIAPKPTTGSSDGNSEGYVKCRSKRKYVRVNKNKKRKNNSKRSTSEKMSLKTVTSSHPVETLSLLPETPDQQENKSVTSDRVSPEKKPTPTPMWLSFNIQPTTPLPRQRPHVVSNVTVECVTDTWLDVNGLGLGCTDVERVMNMEKDTCPGFISDVEDRVVWTNKAYRQMAAVDGEDMAVVLVRKDKWKQSNVTYPAFTCKVKVSSAHENDWETASPSSPTLTLPCDVWRMERGACAWRLDVKAALSLGR